MDGEAIPGTSGTLFTVTLKADVSLTAGTKLTGAVKNIEFNTQDNHKLTFDEVTLSHKSMQKTSALLRADVFEYFMSYYFFSKNRAQNKKKIVPLHLPGRLDQIEPFAEGNGRIDANAPALQHVNLH